MKGDNRKIATILAADVSGYSRLMEEDEEATLTALRTTRQIFEQLVEEFGGQEFGSVGDSLMAQFPSAVNAVRCARAIQDKLSAVNEQQPDDRKMLLRIGINLGDVIEEGNTLYGDGVNVAARIQAIASPGSILTTGSVYDQIENKIDADLQHAGRRFVRNINHPVELYEVLPGSTRSRYSRFSILRRLFTNHPVAGVSVIILITITLVLVTESRFNVHEPTSDIYQNQIAVLPFDNLSNDTSNDWMGLGLSEDIINLLAQIKELKVVTRTSSFQDRLQDMNTPEIGRQLNAHYVLDGSIRYSGEHTLVVAHLDNAETGYNMWSQEYERSSTDTLDVQREIAKQVVKALKLNLPIDFNMDPLKRPTQNKDAYDYYVQAKSFLDKTETEKPLKNAEQFFRRSLEHDPKFGLAYAGLCRTLAHEFELQLSSSVLPDAEEACNQAYKLTPDEYLVHVAMGELYKVQGENEKALSEFKWAKDHSTDNIDARLGIAEVYVQKGDDEAAVNTFQDAIQINPGYSRAYRTYGVYLLAKANYKAAIGVYKHLVELEPNNMGAYSNLGTAYLYSGYIEQAENIFLEVVSKGPNGAGYANLALVNYYKGRFEDAVTLNTEALEVLPDVYYLWGSLGNALLQLPDKEEETKKAYQHALDLTDQQLKVNENQGDVLAYRAYYCAQLNDRDCATSSITKALQLADSNLDTQFNVALTYLILGKHEQAAIHIKKAEELGYSPKLINADPILAPLLTNGRLTATEPGRANQGSNN